MEWVAISFSRGSYWPRDWTGNSYTGRWILNYWATKEAPEKPLSSVQFSRSVVSDSLRPHELPHARPPCLSPALGACSVSCPLNLWCHPIILSYVVTFSSCPQSFPASGSFQMSQLFASGGQSTGLSASTSVLPMNTQDWFPLGWTGWWSYSPRDSQESSPTPQFKSINSLTFSLLHGPTLTSIHDYWEKNIALTIQTVKDLQVINWGNTNICNSYGQIKLCYLFTVYMLFMLLPRCH